MATHEQTPDQTTPTRPTPEQATEAQAYFARPEILDIARNAIRHELGEKGVRHFETILAVAKPPTDEEIAERVAEHHRQHLPCNPFAGRAEHQIKNLRTGDQTFTIAAVVSAIRHFLGPVKP